MKIEVVPGTRILIAQGYPWSLTQNEQYLRELETKIPPYLSYTRQTLIWSVEGRPIDIIAITHREDLPA